MPHLSANLAVSNHSTSSSGRNRREAAPASDDFGGFVDSAENAAPPPAGNAAPTQRSAASSRSAEPRPVSASRPTTPADRAGKPADPSRTNSSGETQDASAARTAETAGGATPDDPAATEIAPETGALEPAAETDAPVDPAAALVDAQAAPVPAPPPANANAPLRSGAPLPAETAALALTRVAQETGIVAPAPREGGSAEDAASPVIFANAAAAARAALDPVHKPQLVANTATPGRPRSAAPRDETAADAETASDVAQAARAETTEGAKSADAASPIPAEASQTKPHIAADKAAAPQPAFDAAAPDQTAADKNTLPTPPIGTPLQHTATPASPTHQFTATAAPAAAIPVAAMAVEIVAQAQIGRSRFDIRLDPPELGRVDVRLDVDNKGQVTSHIIVEKPATLDMLRRDSQQLERALQDAGLKTSDSGLQFSLRDQQSQPGQQNDGEAGRQGRRLLITEDETAPRPAPGQTYGRLSTAAGGVDLRV